MGRKRCSHLIRNREKEELKTKSNLSNLTNSEKYAKLDNMQTKYDISFNIYANILIYFLINTKFALNQKKYIDCLLRLFNPPLVEEINNKNELTYKLISELDIKTPKSDIEKYILLNYQRMVIDDRFL